MSDFDKEAERERLREKYERDQAEREATQRMSDLLLKGARMTNTHCDACGDPLFQQDGVTFCPNCHGGPGGIDGTLPEAETDRTTDDGAEPADVERNAVASSGGDAADGDEGAVAGAETPQPTQRPRDATRGTDTADGTARPRPGERPRPSDQGDIEAGRTALIDALERFASEAAATDDPRYARECLEAAREASEAIAALER